MATTPGIVETTPHHQPSRRWPTWVTVLLLYVVSRLIVGLVFSVVAPISQPASGVLDGSPDGFDFVIAWDGQWYWRIVQAGYPLPLPVDVYGNAIQSEWAFYPLFPLLARVVMALGPSFAWAALLINVTAGAVASLLLARLLRLGRVTNPRVSATLAVTGVALWLCHPATPVLQIAYTESLSLVILLAALLLLIQRRYLACAVAVLAMGLVRAITPAFVVVILVHLALRLRARRRGEDPQAGSWWSAGVLLLASGIATVAWPTYVGWATGRADAYIFVQSSWGQRLDQIPVLPWFDWMHTQFGVAGSIGLLALIVAYLVLMIGPTGSWMAPEVRAWGIVYPLYLLAATRPLTSIWRFLVLDVPLYAALAALLVRRRDGGLRPRSVRIVALVPVVIALIALGVWWCVTLLVYTPVWDWPP